jgi:glycosyltransferase involved in cell wall biosynthesis
MSDQRALFVLPTDRLGGAERVSKLIALEYYARGFHVSVLILSRGRTGGWIDAEEYLDIRYLNSPRESIGMIVSVCSIYRLSTVNSLGVVFSSHTHVNGWLSVLHKTGILRCRRLICRESTVMVDRFAGLKLLSIRLIYLVCYGKQDLIVCQTKYMMLRLWHFVHVSQKWPVVVIPNPCDVKNVTDKSMAAIDGLPPLFICTVGRLIELKGVDLLLRAFMRVRRICSSMHLVIVGDGPEEAALRALVTELDLGSWVIFAGRLTNPMPVLKHAAVGVVCSRIEGFPNTLLEMMALCPRVVSTRCAGGIEEIEGIYTCPTNDSESMADAILQALQSDVEANRKLMELELSKRTPAAFVDRMMALLA